MFRRALVAAFFVPALVLLFGLFLGGRLDATAVGDAAAPAVAPMTSGRASRRLLGTFAAACLVGGVGLMVFNDPGPTFVVGVAALCGCAISTFVLATSDV